MPTIETAGALIPGQTDTPLDVRSRVAALTDVADIANPVLGGIFYCVATGRHYKITALKSKVIGALTVADAAVDTYEELVDLTALAGRVTALESAVGSFESAAAAVLGVEEESES